MPRGKKRQVNQSVNQNLDWNTLNRLKHLAEAGSVQGSSANPQITVKGKKLRVSAGEFLKEYTRQLAEESNWRVQTLRRHGYEHFATEKAMAFTKTNYNTKRYKTKLKSYDDMMKQILSMQRFLGYKTSTVEGYSDILDNRIASARAKYFSGEEYANLTDEQIRDFLYFLGDEHVQAVLQKYPSASSAVQYTSEELVEDIAYLLADNEETIASDLLEQISNLAIADELRSVGVTNTPHADYYHDDFRRWLAKTKTETYNRRNRLK